MLLGTLVGPWRHELDKTHQSGPVYQSDLDLFIKRIYRACHFRFAMNEYL
jgi:hypothetical protein